MSGKLVIRDITQDRLKSTEFFKQKHPKKQVYLHHTVSHPSPKGDINTWRSLPYRIGTALLIAGKPYPTDLGFNDGDIYQCFSTQYWAFHLGNHASGNKIPAKYKTKANTRLLEKQSIAIEICNAGYLTYKNGSFYSTFGTKIPKDQVIDYVDNYRYHRFYHKYTDAQIESLRKILVYLNETYGIPLDYNPNMWDICEEALNGTPGIYTHTSVRSDKTDCHPQPELVKMLMSLKDQESTVS